MNKVKHPFTRIEESHIWPASHLTEGKRNVIDRILSQLRNVLEESFTVEVSNPENNIGPEDVKVSLTGGLYISDDSVDELSKLVHKDIQPEGSDPLGGVAGPALMIIDEEGNESNETFPAEGYELAKMPLEDLSINAEGATSTFNEDGSYHFEIPTGPGPDYIPGTDPLAYGDAPGNWDPNVAPGTPGEMELKASEAKLFIEPSADLVESESAAKKEDLIVEPSTKTVKSKTAKKAKK